MQSALVTEPEHLNSEKIEAKYGSYHIDVIASDGRTRQSALSSESNGTRVCRTFALTQFSDEGDAPSAHGTIRGGASIGATLQRDGWSILKSTIHVGHITITDRQHTVAQLMHLQTPAKLALHIYKLSIEKDGDVVDYATISEIHHPDYLTEDDVRALFSLDTAKSVKPPQVDELISIILDAA
ncbi:MAG: hypothetical protein QNJ19_12925 [Woeseiaceae bacterium]|nr:hypothetical protein [Woeseiaceae bacterium]